MEPGDEQNQPYRPDTIKSTVDTLYNAAITLVESGDLDICELISVRQIVVPENVGLFLEKVMKRTGAHPKENKKSTLAGYASDLLRAAKYGGHIEGRDLDRLRGHCRKANKYIPDSMTRKNRETLGQFQDPEAVLDLEDLEIILINEAEAERVANNGAATETTAFTYMRGLALWLLRVTSYRRRNILRLRSTHIDWPTGKSRVGFVWLSPDDTKTRNEIAGELEPDLVRAMRHFWTHFRPAVTHDPDNDFLFPGRTATGFVNESSFGTQLSKVVARRTGLTFHFHFGRHLTAEILITADRRNMSVVSESLGHAPGSQTAEKRYTTRSQMQAGKTVSAVRDMRRKDSGRRRPKPGF